jgi:hypothetical protein
MYHWAVIQLSAPLNSNSVICTIDQSFSPFVHNWAAIHSATCATEESFSYLQHWSVILSVLCTIEQPFSQLPAPLRSHSVICNIEESFSQLSTPLSIHSVSHLHHWAIIQPVMCTIEQLFSQSLAGSYITFGVGSLWKTSTRQEFPLTTCYKEMWHKVPRCCSTLMYVFMTRSHSLHTSCFSLSLSRILLFL